MSEEELLALGGKKADRGESTIPAAMRKALELKTRQTYEGNDIIFGPEGETQLVFRPSKGRVKGAARWTVCLLPVTTSRYDTHRELSKAGRKLWDLPHPGPLCWGIILRRQTRERLKEMGKPSVAYQAAEQLRACHVEKLQALRVEVTPLHELSERPEIEAVMEQLVKVSELLDTESEQRLRAQAAIGLVVEVLSKGLEEKAQEGVRFVAGCSHWLEEVTNLRFHALALANELQRPPTKEELRERYDPDERKDAAQFSRLLKPAGLSWLPGAKSPRNLR